MLAGILEILECIGIIAIAGLLFIVGGIIDDNRW